MINSPPNVIALDYYDGATSGFSRGAMGLTAFYFHLIAWDNEQDERLFVLTEIEESTYAHLAAALCNEPFTTSTAIHLPTMSAPSQHIKQLEEITEHCKSRAIEGGLFLLTSDVDLSSGTLMKLKGELRSRAAAVLAGGTPDDLALWKGGFQDQPERQGLL